MYIQMSFNVFLFSVALFSHGCYVLSSDAPADALTANRYNAPDAPHPTHLDKLAAQHAAHAAHSHHYQQVQHHVVPAASGHAPSVYHPPVVGGGHIEKRNSYNLLSEAMSQAVSNEFSALGSGSADGACHVDDLECYSNNVQDRLGMEAIRTLHRQLDDDDNGNIDLSESDDFLREELKYDSGYEKRQKAFHFNDDMHISVKELWEAWLRSEVHNWTIEQTTDWLAQSVQLPQYVELFKLHKVTGAALPRLAVNNMHYVGNVLGIKDPIHKQKIALKAMDVVLFGPPRETGTRWKDYILVTLLLSAIIGCWYAYQQNKNAKRHLRRMAQDMEGLQRAEQSLQEMQKELERARMEQENVETEKLDLERRLKEAPLLSSSSSDLEVQQLKKEIEMLRSELSRAEIELVDNCWTPPPQLQSLLQYTYELESKNHLKKRISAEKQLQSAREACEKLRKKRSSLVGAFVSTHGKSIDDVDRSIVEARNALGEVTNELQERLHRWKQIESCLGFNITNNNGLTYLESVLYGRNGGIGISTASSKGSRGRITSSTDDLDDESVAGMFESYSRSSLLINSSASNASNVNCRDDTSSEEGVVDTSQAVQFYLGNVPPPQALAVTPERPPRASHLTAAAAQSPPPPPDIVSNAAPAAFGNHIGGAPPPLSTPITPLHHNNAPFQNYTLNDSQQNVAATLDNNNSRHSPSVSSESSVAVPPRAKKQNLATDVVGRAPMPPPRKAYQSQMLRSQSTDLVPLDVHTAYFTRQQQQQQQHQQSAVQQQQQPHHQQLLSGSGSLNATTTLAAPCGNIRKTMVKQHSTASQQSSSSTSSSVQSAPPAVAADNGCIGQLPLRWSTPERISPTKGQQHHFELQPNAVAISAAAYHKPMPASLGLQSTVCSSKSQQPADSNVIVGAAAAATQSAAIAASTHGNTELEKSRQTASAIAADTVSLPDTASLDGSTKKRRRRLRFPFGSGSSKKSSSNSRDSVNDDVRSNSSKSKLA